MAMTQDEWVDELEAQLLGKPPGAKLVIFLEEEWGNQPVEITDVSFTEGDIQVKVAR